jgi:DNA-binding NtrC family response regulator
VILIAEELIERAAKRHNVPVPTLTSEVRTRLLSYQWPGNVSELKNAVERAVLLSRHGDLDVQRLVPLAIQPCSTPERLSVSGQRDGMTVASSSIVGSHYGTKGEA